MTGPIPNNNEFEVAEIELRNIGSNLWFGGLSEEWQYFLVSNTVDFFDTYEVSMRQAANAVLIAYRKIANHDPSILQSNPFEKEIKFI